MEGECEGGCLRFWGNVSVAMRASIFVFLHTANVLLVHVYWKGLGAS